MNNRFLRVIFIIAVILAIIVSDQWSKSVIKNSPDRYTPYPVVGNLFELRYTENSGGFLGLGSSLPQNLKPAVFLIIPAIVLSFLLFFVLYNYVYRNTITNIDTFACCCILAGGVGNLIDRALYNGNVIDFMVFGIGELKTGVMNIADMAISLGITIIVINQFKMMLFEKKNTDTTAA
jgi:signal peptidase II